MINELEAYLLELAPKTITMPASGWNVVVRHDSTYSYVSWTSLQLQGCGSSSATILSV